MLSVLDKICATVGLKSPKHPPESPDPPHELFNDPEHFYLVVEEKRQVTTHTGAITQVTDKMATIDEIYCFHLDNVKLRPLEIGDRVSCTLYSNELNTIVKDVHLIEDHQGALAKHEALREEYDDELSGIVAHRDGRDLRVDIEEYGTVDKVECNLNCVSSDFVPVVGDKVKVRVVYEREEEEAAVNSSRVARVVGLRPVHRLSKLGRVTSWDPATGQGLISGYILFNQVTCEPGYVPDVKDKVYTQLIRSQGAEGTEWRALQVMPHARAASVARSPTLGLSWAQIEETKHELSLEKRDVVVVLLDDSSSIAIHLANGDSSPHQLNNCRRSSLLPLPSLTLVSPTTFPLTIHPGQVLAFEFQVSGRFLGRSTEEFLWEFEGGFLIGRRFNVDVVSPKDVQTILPLQTEVQTRVQVTARSLLERQSGVIMPGRRSFCPAAFVPVKLAQYSLPDHMIELAMPDCKMSLDKHMKQIKRELPFMRGALSPYNYAMRMEHLLYLEEVALLKQVNELDIVDAKFVEKGDCLVLNVPAYSPYTLKLVAGDMLVAKWPAQDKKFEGVIHQVSSTGLWLQFSKAFHEQYAQEPSGCSVGFVTSRASLRRMHQAIELAVKYLGLSWLFPTRVSARSPQVVIEAEAEASHEELRTASQDPKKDMSRLLSKVRRQSQASRRRGGAGAEGPTSISTVLSLKQAMKQEAAPRKSIVDEIIGAKKEGNGVRCDPRKIASSLPKRELAPAPLTPTLQPYKRAPKKGKKGNSIHWNRQGSGYGARCTTDNEARNPLPDQQSATVRWFNKGLNEQQKSAVRNVLSGEGRPLPYIIFGPPGTGKTVTVVETILQIYQLIPQSRILVATPSNSASDLIAGRLIETGILSPHELLRMVGYHYLEQGRISPLVQPYSAVPDVKALTVPGTPASSYEGVQMVSREALGQHRITVGTMGCLGLLYNMGFPRGHFTHIIIDEAGQATEPEVLIPMVFLHLEYGQVVLAGDPLQLGPVVTSRLAASFGLQDSLLSRLLDRFPYVRDPDGFSELAGYDPRLVTKLVHNYRSLPKILTLTSMMFYHNDLIPNVSETESVEAIALEMLKSKLPCSSGWRASPILFHGIRGTNRQEDNSHSWYNHEEALQAVRYLTTVYEAGIRAEDVGIITPYQLQSTRIRLLIESEHLDMPKVGSVEEFQGQEKLVIIVSVVRSQANHVTEEMERSLGFVANGRRLNVALSRARALLIILGNPHLLTTVAHWRTVVKYCIDHKAYIGCDLPRHLHTHAY